MFTSLRILACILCLSVSSTANSDNSTSQYCKEIAGLAAGLSLSKDVAFTNAQLETEARIISSKFAFDYEYTRGIIFKVAEDSKITTLTAAEFAGFHAFWCVYDVNEVPAGSDVFDVQTQVINAIQTILEQNE